MRFDILNPYPKINKWIDNIGDEWDGNSGVFFDRAEDGIRYIFLDGMVDPDNLIESMDWKAVFDFFPTKVFDTYCHRGFYRYGKLAFDYISKNLLTKDRPAVIYGYSLGAATAVHVSMMLKEAGYNIINCVTYGVPAAWGSLKLRKIFRKMFPNAKSYILGNDFSRLLNIPIFWLSYRPPVKFTRIKRKYASIKDWIKGFVEDHLLSVMKNFEIPPPWENN